MQKPLNLLKEKKQAVILTIIASSLWGTSFPAIKIGLFYMDALIFVFLRFFIATLIMLIFAVVTKNFSFDFVNKRLIIFLGLTNGIAYLLQYIGMTYTSASNSSLLVNLTVVWVALLSPLIIKERISKKKIVGVILSIIGIFFITTNLDINNLNLGETSGNLIVIAAGIVWALFIIYNKPLVNKNNNMIQSFAWLLLFTMLPLIPVVPFSINSFLNLPLEAWMAIIYTAIFCWIIPYHLWAKGLKNISPVTSSVILLNEILVAILISVFFLGEILTLITGVGALFIIIAIIIVSLR